MSFLESSTDITSKHVRVPMCSVRLAPLALGQVRAMVHALHAVRKELAQSNQLVQSLHTQMTSAEGATRSRKRPGL